MLYPVKPRVYFLLFVLAAIFSTLSPVDSHAQTGIPATVDCDPATPALDAPIPDPVLLGRRCEVYCGVGNIVSVINEADFQCMVLQAECVAIPGIGLRYQAIQRPAGTMCDRNDNLCDGGQCVGLRECSDPGARQAPDGTECQDLDGSPCTIEHCQEGVCRPANPGSQRDIVNCDDSNACTVDICDASTRLTPGQPRTDACDYTNVPYGTSPLCPRCGDAITQTAEGEACDDGNTIPGDGCNRLCQIESCGNGRLDFGEECDDNNNTAGDGCSPTCRNEAVACPTLNCVPANFVFNPALPMPVICTATGGTNWTSATIECGAANSGITPANRSAQCSVSNLGNTVIALADVTGPADVRDCGTFTVTSTAACGDNVVNQASEACDNGPNNSNTQPNACRTNCALSRCGDGVTDAGEGCDDANTVNNDGCTNNCALPTCGDGIVQGNEDCDDRNANNADGCLTTCEFARCGDGFVQQGVEACDDSNAINTDDCLNNCTLPRCGDGFTRAGVEACDDGNASNNDTCLVGCIEARCGDGFTRTGFEGCDDGNNNNTDACTNACAVSTCGDGFVRGGVEQCDDANRNNNDACLDSCVPATCGDGFVRVGVEACDDANANDSDACRNNCSAARCGDGVVQAGVEACDQGAANSNTAANACRTDCTVSRCGDGVTDALEACDDANADNTDGCLSNCTLPVVTCVPTTEVCDGVDNDCDGLIDEDLGEASCGTGACYNVVPLCVNGTPQTCAPLTPGAEICNDSIDNDCDGQIDEGCNEAPICDGPDENGDGIPDVCLTPTQACLASGNEIEEIPHVSIQDVLASENKTIQLNDQYVIKDGVIIGQCVSVKASTKMIGSSFFGAFSIFEILALALAGLWAVLRPKSASSK